MLFLSNDDIAQVLTPADCVRVGASRSCATME